MEVLARYRFFVFLLFLSVVFFASDVQFAHKSGDQKTGVQPAIMSLLLSDAEAQAQSSGVKVYDNDNQYLGLLLELDRAHCTVFVPSAGASWDYSPYNNAPCFTLNPVSYDSSDCSGTPYVYGPLPELVDLSNFGGGFYKQDYKRKRTFTPGSILQSDCSCQTSTGTNQEYYPLVQVPFTTPIALPLRFEVSTGTAASKRTVVILMF